MSIKLLKKEVFNKLFDNIESNLDKYRNGDFNDLVSNKSYYKFSELNVDINLLSNIVGGQENDIDNCLLMFNAIDGLSPSLARDKRLWSYLTHTHLFNYTKERWPIPEDDTEAIASIKNHFFILGPRDFERNNAASRLWWSTFICKRVNIDTKKILKVLLYRPDARNQLIDRTTTALSTHLFEAILEKMIDSYEGDQKFLTGRHSHNRPFMREVNTLGGFNLLNALTLEQSREKLKEIEITLSNSNQNDTNTIEENEEIHISDEEIKAYKEDSDTIIEDISPSSQDHENEIVSNENLGLRDKLVKFAQELSKKHPNTDPNEKVLSRYMLFLFLDLKPRNMGDFVEKFSEDDRLGISPDESTYVREICKIIDDHLDD
jgi:hypothetical protein